MYIDWYYIVLVLPAVLLSVIASMRVNSTFKKYSSVNARSGLTGHDAAVRVLSDGNAHGVSIDRISGNLTDNYNPSDKTIHLSQNVFDSSSVSAIGVAAHEAGHAVQHATGYSFFKLRSAIVPTTNLTSKIGAFLIPIGIILCYAGLDSAWVAYLGVILYSSCFVFQLVTLPTEFNASRRALKALEATGSLDSTELSQAKKVLSAAAMTYVAALAVSAMTILRFLLIIAGADNRRKR